MGVVLQILASYFNVQVDNSAYKTVLNNFYS